MALLGVALTLGAVGFHLTADQRRCAAEFSAAAERLHRLLLTTPPAPAAEAARLAPLLHAAGLADPGIALATGSASSHRPDQPAGASLVHEFVVAAQDGTPLHVQVTATAAWCVSQSSRASLLLLGTGLGATALLTWLAQRGQRRAERIQRELGARTAALAERGRQITHLLEALPGMAFRRQVVPGPATLYLSPGTLPLSGYTPEEVHRGAPAFDELVHPEDRVAVAQALTDATRQLRTYEIEYRLRHRTDGDRHVLERGCIVVEGDRLIAEGLIVDLSTRHSAEQERLELQRRLAAHQRSESLGVLAGGIAHDFNNLLTAILGHAGLASLSLRPGSSEYESLQQIEAAVERASALCQQLLAYAGKAPQDRRPVQLNELIRETIPLLNIANRRVQPGLDLGSDLAPVLGDRGQLQQVIVQLVINAAEAVFERGGTVTLRTALWHAHPEDFSGAIAGDDAPAGEYVLLEVRDTGPGIAPEDLARVFEPFYSTKFPGRGLGLPATLGIVRTHHGVLRVQSAPGQGATLQVLLPVAPTDPGATKRPDSASPWRGAGRVLLVDDEDVVRDITARLLRHLGFTVDDLPDAESALARIQADPRSCDVLMLDLTMPGVSGGEALTRVRRLVPELPVLLYSGYPESEVADLLARDPRVAFLPKPFTLPAARAKLRLLTAQ